MTCQIHYAKPLKMMNLASDKLLHLSKPRLDGIDFENIKPDSKNNYWLNQSDSPDFERLLPLVDRQNLASKVSDDEQAIFKLLFSWYLNSSG